jgi:hypothetical protein
MDRLTTKILLYELTLVHEAHPQQAFARSRFLAMLEMTEVVANSGTFDFASKERERSCLNGLMCFD